MIVIRPAFERAAKRLSRAQKDAVNAAVERLPVVFGRPHQHSGVGLRPFGRYLELRVGLGCASFSSPKAATCISAPWATMMPSAPT